MAYTFSGFGQAAFYNMMSTYFVVYVTSALFAGVNKDIATKLVGIITGAIVLIRIGEIFIDHCSATLSITPTPESAGFALGNLLEASSARSFCSWCSPDCSVSST